MDVIDRFAEVSALMCEPARAKMLWSLLDGKAYTATELAAAADISATSASNHLAKLLEADFLRVESQGRHRYYAFANPDVAYAVEALAQLSKMNVSENKIERRPTGIKYCRTCYDHLAGFVGVQLVEAMEIRQYLEKTETNYTITKKGWHWLGQFDISADNYANVRRPTARQCLDWSERRPHLAGQLGADLLQALLRRKWFRKVQLSREMVVTPAGRKEMLSCLGVELS
jgi:DNA-binding transcriptional ArsR family regulator